MDSVAASPRSASMGAIADALIQARNWLNRQNPEAAASPDPYVRAISKVPVGALLGKAPEEIDRWSYYNSPLKMRPQGVRLPEIPDERKAPVLDALSMMPVGTAAKGAGMPLAAILAMKPKGGAWLPSTAQELAMNLRVMPGLDRGYTGFEERTHEFDRMVKNWLNKYAGTSEDPIKDIEVLQTRVRPHDEYEEVLGPLENLTDKVFVGKPAEKWLGGSYRNRGVPSAAQIVDRSFIEQAAKKNPEETVYGLDPYAEEFGALTAHLRHVGDTLVDVPTADLKRWDLIRAVRETARRDAERAKKLGTIEGSLEGTKPIKAYPDSGYQWVEVQTSQALKNEGDVMGHCVGGYCDRVESGESRIFSLRDPKGQAHVTIEATPEGTPSQFLGSFEGNKLRERMPGPVWVLFKEKHPELTPDRLEREWKNHKAEYNEKIMQTPEWRAWLSKQPLSIQQIRGKQNAAPKAEYLPQVQDFLRSQKWQHIYEAENAGLWDIRDGKYLTVEELREEGAAMLGPAARSMAPSEIRMRLAALGQGRRE